MTVGSGFSPDLLTPLKGRSWAHGTTPIYHRWGISPRPENTFRLSHQTPSDKLKCDRAKEVCDASQSNFRKTDTQRSLDFARQTGFGNLMAVLDDRPLVSHIPFLIDEEQGEVELHLVRSNPMAQLLKSGVRPAKLAVTGPHGYISPDWYGVKDQVPTWNYVAVHLSGSLSLQPQENIRALIDRLSEEFEARLALKTVWKSSKMTPDVLDKMMCQIVPCRLVIKDIQSTWKLGQNKPDAARLRAADQIKNSRVGAQMAELAELMRRAGTP